MLDLVKDAKAPVFLILNKIDLIKKVRLLPLMQQYSEMGTFAEIVPVSAGPATTWTGWSGRSSIGCRRASRCIRPTT